MLTVDNLAQRYSKLPTECLAHATTFDLQVADIATKWANHKTEQANRQQANPHAPVAPHLSQEQMKAMMASVKER